MDDIDDRKLTAIQVRFEISDAETVQVSTRSPSSMLACDAWPGCQQHRMRNLPERDDHRNAHDPIGKCCPSNQRQPKISDQASNKPEHTALLWAE